jgi:LemA protein
MSRIGAIVRKLYGEEVKPVTNNIGAAMNAKTNRKKRRFENFKNALGSRRTVVWIIRIVIVLVVLFIVAESIFQFNRFASWQTKVMARRADVEREFQRRENLIPNLVYAVSRYGMYEQGVFKYVSDAREALKTVRSSETSGTQVGSLLEKTLSRLVALAEEYPDLKATQSVQDLISEASNTEDRIAEAKKEYNKDCEIYNQYLSIFPGNIFGFLYRYKSLPYMGLEDVNVPVIDLDMTEPETVVEEVVEVPASNLKKTEGAKE